MRNGFVSAGYGPVMGSIKDQNFSASCATISILKELSSIELAIAL
jgi:hypothetical protein